MELLVGRFRGLKFVITIFVHSFYWIEGYFHMSWRSVHFVAIQDPRAGLTLTLLVWILTNS